jgi:ABC-2 type transport system ATP-binding protein
MQLHITGLCKTYPNGVQALADVSLTLPAGMFGLLGPNGAGKSTLMRTLATLQDADSGSVQFEEGGRFTDVLRNKQEVRKFLGYLPQDFGVYPKMQALALLDHLARLKGLTNGPERREVVDAVLRQTNLYDVRHKALGTFSGGMRQRFGIAQALLGNPKLIIVDEPTAGLDPEERVRFLNLLADIGEQVVVILSTHIVADVSDLCSNLAILHRGRVVLNGRPDALTARLEGRVFASTVARTELAGEMTRHAVLSSRLAGGENIIYVLADRAPDARFKPVPPTLEHVYFATIGGHLEPVPDPLGAQPVAQA